MTVTADAFHPLTKNLEGFLKGSNRGAFWLKILSGVFFFTGTFLLLVGGLGGSLVSAGSGGVGLAAAAWSIRQLYRVWKDGRFLEILGGLAEYAKTLSDSQRTQLLKEFVALMLQWVKVEEPLPGVKK